MKPNMNMEGMGRDRCYSVGKKINEKSINRNTHTHKWAERDNPTAYTQYEEKGCMD